MNIEPDKIIYVFQMIEADTEEYGEQLKELIQNMDNIRTKYPLLSWKKFQEMISNNIQEYNNLYDIIQNNIKYLIELGEMVQNFDTVEILANDIHGTLQTLKNQELRKALEPIHTDLYKIYKENIHRYQTQKIINILKNTAGTIQDIDRTEERTKNLLENLKENLQQISIFPEYLIYENIITKTEFEELKQILEEL